MVKDLNAYFGYRRECARTKGIVKFPQKYMNFREFRAWTIDYCSKCQERSEQDYLEEYLAKLGFKYDRDTGKVDFASFEEEQRIEEYYND